jgi:tRNA 2-thiouridine synthesizing protein A
MMESIDFDQELDCYGLWCPMPIVKAAEEIRTLEPGQILKIVATDEAAEEDFKAWARKTGNTFLDSRREEEVLEIYIRKD